MMVGDRCHPYRADLVCRGRYDAIMRGAFLWDELIGGFVCTDLEPREQLKPGGQRGLWLRIFYEVEDCTGEPFVLERCPFCAMPLPEHPLQSADPYEGRDVLKEWGLSGEGGEEGRDRLLRNQGDGDEQ